MLFEAQSTRFIKRTLLGVLMLGALAVMAFNFVHPGRAQRLGLLAASQGRLESMMLEAERDNEALTAELQRLERGAEGWQSLARKEYGMLLPGEVVFRFPPAEAAR